MLPRPSEKQAPTKPAKPACPKTTRKRKQPSDDDEYDGSEVKEAAEESDIGSQAREMELLEKTVKRMKKQSAAEDKFCTKFDTQASADVNTAISSLRGKYNSVMKNMNKAIVTFSELPTTLNVSDFHDHDLFGAQAKLLQLGANLMKAHEPLQSTIKMALEALTVASDWERDGDDAVRALCLLKEETEKTLQGMIESAVVTDKEPLNWGAATRMAGSGIRRALKDAPVTPICR